MPAVTGYRKLSLSLSSIVIILSEITSARYKDQPAREVTLDELKLTVKMIL